LSTAADAGRLRLEDLVSYDGAHGRIRAKIMPSAGLEALVRKEAEHGGLVRFTVEDASGVWALQFVEGGRSRGALTILTCYDITDPGPFCCFSLVCGNGITDFKAYAFSGPARRGRFSILLSEKPDAVRLSWRLPLDALPPQHEHAVAPAVPLSDFTVREDISDLLQIKTSYPQAWSHYCAPLLRRLGAGHLLHRHPAADVYRVFDRIEPGAEIAQRVDDLISSLGSASFADRSGAGDALQQMGRNAILPLLRTDFATLSPEQTDRVHRLVFADDWQPIALDPAAATKSLGVMLDCLDDDDPDVRAAAKQAVEKLIAMPLTVQLPADSHLRGIMVDALCDQLRDAVEFQQTVGRVR